MNARIAGADIRYDVQGSGPALLFLHAFPLGLVMWDDQAAGLSASARVIRFDDRGFGGSSPAGGALTMERIADDAAALLDHLGVDKAVVAGCSMGGYACLAFARRHPGRLLGLVLQDTRAGADSPEARAGRTALADRVLAEGAAVAADTFLPKLLGATTHREHPNVVARVRDMILGNAPRGIADALHGLGARVDSTPTLATIRVPTLVVCGAEDTLTPPSESEAMVAGIAGARLELVPGAGHLANLENPQAYNRVVGAFVGGLGES
jgi:pimeloyl-ACP methyl ester carboxylesterase